MSSICRASLLKVFIYKSGIMRFHGWIKIFWVQKSEQYLNQMLGLDIELPPGAYSVAKEAALEVF